MQASPAPVPASNPETILWTGTTSQWVHFWYYLICVVLAAGAIAGGFFFPLAFAGLAIPVVLWIIRWWLTKTTVYELSTQRLRKSSGILHRKIEDLELYRVKDYSLELPILLRMLGLGNLRMVTSDASTPVVEIPAVRDAQNLREILRTAVQQERDRKRVRELDVDGPGGSIV